ncbi:unnamed protein product [Ixodes pacificus]
MKTFLPQTSGKQAKTKDGKDCFVLKFPKARKSEWVNRKIEPASYGNVIVVIIFAIEHSGRGASALGWPKTVFAAAVLAAAGPQGLAVLALATVPPRLPTPTTEDQAGSS